MTAENMALDRYTTDINGQLIQADNGELIHYGNYLELQAIVKHYEKLISKAAGALDKAFEFDGDVFGKMHNEATDILSELQSIAIKNKLPSKLHPRCEHGKRLGECFLSDCRKDYVIWRQNTQR